jgi:PQQ-like domain
MCFSLPAFSVTVSPTSATVTENATQQFTASTASTWSTSCGSISSSGLLKAPLYPTTTCSVTATATNGSGSATAKVTVTSPITMTPTSAKTPQGNTQQFTASMPVTWVAKCGSISASGLYTASGTVGTNCTIQGIATGTVKYTVYGYDTITAPASTTFTISPASATIQENATQQFTSSTAATWSSTCGSISSSGLLKAPLYPSTTCAVTGTSTGGSESNTAKVTIVSPIVMTPTSAKTPQGQTQQFSANMPVTWTAKCGTISSTGLYTASGTVGTNCTIQAIATGTVKYTAYGYDSITAPGSTTFTISPLSPTVTEGGTQQFTASSGASFTASCGTISSTGLLTAPLSPSSCTITATATDGSGRTASTVATVSSPIVITPSGAGTPQGQTQQFTATSPVTWAASCGSIDTKGLFTASAAQGSACKITATASTGTAYTANVVDTVGAAPTLTIAPLSPTIAEGGQQQFTSNVASTWISSCGTIGVSSGMYTAPLAPGSCTITATANDGSGHKASTTATIPSPLTITPASATTGQGQTQQFTASAPVAWTASCGGINANGLFTASATQGSVCTITATAASGTAHTATAADTIGAAPAFTLSPLSPTVNENATQQFTTSLSATFTASCGTIANTGLYTAPLAAGPCTVTATETSDSSKTAFTTVTVTSPLVVTPPVASTGAETTEQFTSNLPATWRSSCGTINANGLFTAPNSKGSVCIITATASSGTAYTGTATDTIGAAPAITIAPLAPTLSEGGTQQFTSNIAATFSATCGSIDANAGSYTAPLTAGTCTITATASDGSGSTAPAKATIASPIAITPASATTVENGTQQFSANVPVTWSSSCGNVNAGGLFTAPTLTAGATGTVCQITATASSGTAYTATAVDTVAQAPTLTLSPLNPSLSQAGTQQFTTNITATFKAMCGTIDASGGLYTAPLQSGNCTVTSTSTDASAQVVSTNVTVTSPLVIQPSIATTPQGMSQNFTANMAATWSSSCGSIDSSGNFAATASVGSTCTITATATGATAYTATASDTIAAAAILTIAPTTLALNENATQQFTSSAPATYTASCGTITSAGLYTAPSSPGTCTVTATPASGVGNSASATVTVVAPLTITPATVKLHALNNQTYSASQVVNWSASCGSISSEGVFTAPATANTCTITATASSGSGSTATASATIDVVNQVRWRNNPNGTGLQPNELQLTPSNVNSTSFGQTWSAAVDGGVWAQPLYMNAITINGAPHNVLYVGTDNDSMYALDADSGAQLWTKSLIPPGATAVAGTMVDTQYISSIGILGTPAIDSGTLYVVSETAEQNATVFIHRLHALDIATGNEVFGGPVVISDPNLPPAHKLQRPGLTVVNGSVYVSMGSLGDKAPYHGFVFAFNQTTLAQQGVWNSTPTGTEGGIWMAGGAPTVDSSGNIYVLTGNGYSDGVTNFGESIVKLSPTLQLLSFFTPHDAASLTAADLDLGAASAPLMPDVNGQFPHELIFCGKSPMIYVVNRDSMGGFNSTTDNVIQELANAVGGTATGRNPGMPCFTTPSSWGTNVYFIANGDVLKQFSLDASTGKLSTTPLHQGTFAYGWPGSQSMISSNGSSNGIIWSFDHSGTKLRADDASNVSTNLYVSPGIGTGYLKWVTPTVINGHVYVGGQGTVAAFGLK